mmetsp:Transcript_11007/g.16860  ORF Transcript_11007/g.16860 Transcript_11007/m.16860 type:complete len:396 (+) Transcript_11007:61-1248(+)
MGKSSKSRTTKSSSAATTGDNNSAQVRRSKKDIKPNGTTTTAAPEKKSRRSKEFPILPFGIFMAVVGIVLYIPYQRYGASIFSDRTDWTLSEKEWQEKMQSKQLLLLGGPHRGGTSIIWKCLKAHPSISGFGDSFVTGVDESEGILMQDIYPRFGIGFEDFRTKFPNWSTSGQGVGQYALGDEVHMTESHKLVTVENRVKLWNRFGPYWDFSKPVVMEKSPPTIVTSRFLQALHTATGIGTDETNVQPYFLFMTRHPLAILLATEKMMGTNYLPYDRMMENYIQMYRYLKEDLPYLKNKPQLVSLEAFAQDPQGTLVQLFQWLNLPTTPDTFAKLDIPTIHSDPNAKYRQRWCHEPKLQMIRTLFIEKYQKILTTELSFLGYDLVEWCNFNTATN